MCKLENYIRLTIHQQHFSHFAYHCGSFTAWYTSQIYHNVNDITTGWIITFPEPDGLPKLPSIFQTRLQHTMESPPGIQLHLPTDVVWTPPLVFFNAGSRCFLYRNLFWGYYFSTYDASQATATLELVTMSFTTTSVKLSSRQLPFVILPRLAPHLFCCPLVLI